MSPGWTKGYIYPDGEWLCYDFRQQHKNTAHLVPARCLADVECVQVNESTYIARVGSDSVFEPSSLREDATVCDHFENQEHEATNNSNEETDAIIRTPRESYWRARKKTDEFRLLASRWPPIASYQNFPNLFYLKKIRKNRNKVKKIWNKMIPNNTMGNRYNMRLNRAHILAGS